MKSIDARIKEGLAANANALEAKADEERRQAIAREASFLQLKEQAAKVRNDASELVKLFKSNHQKPDIPIQTGATSLITYKEQKRSWFGRIVEISREGLEEETKAFWIFDVHITDHISSYVDTSGGRYSNESRSESAVAEALALDVEGVIWIAKGKERLSAGGLNALYGQNQEHLLNNPKKITELELIIEGRAEDLGLVDPVYNQNDTWYTSEPKIQKLASLGLRVLHGVS